MSAVPNLVPDKSLWKDLQWNASSLSPPSPSPPSPLRAVATTTRKRSGAILTLVGWLLWKTLNWSKNSWATPRCSTSVKKHRKHASPRPSAWDRGGVLPPWASPKCLPRHAGSHQRWTRSKWSTCRLHPHHKRHRRHRRQPPPKKRRHRSPLLPVPSAHHRRSDSLRGNHQEPV